MTCMFRCVSKCMSFQSLNLRLLLFLLSNLTTALVVYLAFYFYHYHLYENDYVADRSLLSAPLAPVGAPNHHVGPTPNSILSPNNSTVVYYYFSRRTDSVPISSRQDKSFLCKPPFTNTTTTTSSKTTPESKRTLASNLSKPTSPHTSSDTPSLTDAHNASSQANKNGTKVAEEVYMPYVIGVTPTYYRLTQKLELTSLCQTLMNVPRFLWIVVEDASENSQQVKEILSRCQVESILLHAVTTAATKKAKQRGIDQRNKALEWIRDRCRQCKAPTTCEGVVYFMDDDNTYDIRLFEKIRLTQRVSVFPVGLVAGLKFEGPICKNGKVEKWQVQYSPKRHIPVDMAAFAINIKVLMEKPSAIMGFRDNTAKKRSVPGYIEPDFLRNLGAKRDSVECRGASDEILVWHVKASYAKLVYEKKHPSDPKVKV